MKKKTTTKKPKPTNWLFGSLHNGEPMPVTWECLHTVRGGRLQLYDGITYTATNVTIPPNCHTFDLAGATFTITGELTLTTTADTRTITLSSGKCQTFPGITLRPRPNTPERP